LKGGTQSARTGEACIPHMIPHTATRLKAAIVRIR